MTNYKKIIFDQDKTTEVSNSTEGQREILINVKAEG